MSLVTQLEEGEVRLLIKCEKFPGTNVLYSIKSFEYTKADTAEGVSESISSVDFYEPPVSCDGCDHFSCIREIFNAIHWRLMRYIAGVRQMDKEQKAMDDYDKYKRRHM